MQAPTSLRILIITFLFSSKVFGFAMTPRMEQAKVNCQNNGLGASAIQAVYRTAIEPAQDIMLHKTQAMSCSSKLSTSVDRLRSEIEQVSRSHGSVGFQQWALEGSLEGWKNDDWSCGIMSCPLGYALKNSKNLAFLKQTCSSNACTASLGPHSKKLCSSFTRLTQTKYKDFMIQYHGLNNIMAIFSRNL